MKNRYMLQRHNFIPSVKFTFLLYFLIVNLWWGSHSVVQLNYSEPQWIAKKYEE